MIGLKLGATNFVTLGSHGSDFCYYILYRSDGVLGRAIIIDRNSSPGCQLPPPPPTNTTTLTFYYFSAHKWIDKYRKLFIKQGPAAAICLCNFEWSANMLMFQSLLQLLQFVTLVMFVCLHFLCSFNVRRAYSDCKWKGCL